MPSAKIGDIDIYYEEQGQGEPVLLAPPSWWPSDTWKVGVVPFLSKQYRTIIFDCRGTGYSGKPDHGYTIEPVRQGLCGASGTSENLPLLMRRDLRSAGRSFRRWRSSGPIWSLP